MEHHPEQSPADPTGPLPTGDTQARARALIAAVEDAYQPAVSLSYRDDTPLPTTGDALPVIQPGRPPMSQRATDASALILAAGAASLPAGGSVALMLWALGHTDPAVLGMAGGIPVAALLALARLLGRVKAVAQAAPPTHHHHYTAPVHQESHHHATTTRGVFARTTTKNGR
ncbi:hypothetical protein [Streptomyces sp. 8L]|uniref:hypothetical protein n=1 Tax=Streptomyces sp. 8L TaxID=2877242 RepID=UPI001CD581C5|nr:hypothetical protein [Streptomyces sp. 8L]MCA1222199.1 hypothetical protein [Streptomyces sp. 8L]